jgi:hypothetical protein
MLNLINIKNLIRKQYILHKLYSDLSVSINMNWWKKAYNEANRIKRVKSL